MANLYTYMIKSMKQNTDMLKHHKGVVKRLDSILKDVEILMEDPLFIDGIHGEQELSLDQTIELFNGIRSHFVTPDSLEAKAPGFETNSFDVS